jgi:hypothetical protein
MKPPSPALPAGRPPKRKRSEAELQALARLLGADWTPGDTVQTWINRHEGRTGELSRMVEDGWLWEDIGKAMHIAGITYRTGHPIPAHTLRLKAYLSREREHERAAAKAARQAGQHATARPRPAPAEPQATPDTRETETPGLDDPGHVLREDVTFPLVSLKGGPPQPPQAKPKPLDPPATPPVPDADILRRVFGKP